jgi:hypothetical protein
MPRLAVALCVLLFLSVISTQAAAIGIAMAHGSFRVDSSLVVGNTTLFEGNTLETERASSELELSSGAHVRLGADSRGRVFGDRIELQKGLTELEAGKGYWIEARGLRFHPAEPGSAGRVALTGGRGLQALALAGSFRVTAADGTVVALLAPGRALEFEPQAVTGVQAPFQMTGCLERRDGGYVLRDPISGVTEEVRGEGLASNAGRMVEVMATIVPGEKPVAGALEVIQINRMRRVSGECVLPPAPAAAKPAPPPATAEAPPAAQPAAPPAAAPTPPAPAQARKPGMSAGSKAVIAGVIIGGAGAGAVVYWKTQQNADKTPISR